MLSAVFGRAGLRVVVLALGRRVRGHVCLVFFFFFNVTATTEIYTLSLHDALPIFPRSTGSPGRAGSGRAPRSAARSCRRRDRKSTRLNSSHTVISYAVFCLKKKTGIGCAG